MEITLLPVRTFLVPVHDMNPKLFNWNLRNINDDYDKISASIWIRCLQLIPYLRALSIESTLNVTNSSALIHVFVRNQDAKAYRLARKLKKRGHKIVFDLVVNYFDLAPNIDGAAGTSAQNIEECRRMVELADVVTCSSDFIRERASAFHDNAVYIPDSVDMLHFRYKKLREDFQRDTIRAIWSGISDKASDLVPIYPMLQKLKIPLVIISDKRPNLPGPYTYIPWTYHTFPQAILEGEIFVGPRRLNNPYNQGHSNFKIGVFMAQGIPALGAPLRSYKELIGTEGPGVLCDSDESWMTALETVSEDRKLLQQWSEKSIEVMQDYTTEAVAKTYCRLFD